MSFQDCLSLEYDLVKDNLISILSNNINKNKRYNVIFYSDGNLPTPINCKISIYGEFELFKFELMTYILNNDNIINYNTLASDRIKRVCFIVI
ncbi:MAG: hypothetical protein WCP65_01180 [Bacteroidota bacterium]